MKNPIIKKQGINYLRDENGKIKKYKPWLGDLFSFLYNRIMEKSVFPKLFKGSIEKHFEILKSELKHIHNASVLEIGTGSGILAEILPNDNQYVGIDISKGLLKKAKLRFRKNGFKNFALFNTSADELPFEERFYTEFRVKKNHFISKEIPPKFSSCFGNFVGMTRFYEVRRQMRRGRV